MMSVRGRRRGQMLAGILLLIALLGVLAYGLYSMMLGFTVQAHRVGANLGVDELALSGLAAAAAHLRDLLRPDAPLARELAAGASKGGPLAVDISSERDLLLADYPGATLEVSAVLGTPKTLSGASPTDPAEKTRLTQGRGWDPRELRLPVTLTARAAWDGSDRTLTVQRELAVVNLSPGTLGKFTLWARDLTPQDAAGFSSSFDGLPLASSKRPLVLHNGGAAPEDPTSRDPQSYRRRGYVYLGGEPRLALTAGYLGYGELWTFLPIEELSGLSASSALPVYTDGDPPDFFKVAHAGQKLDLRHMITGFYDGPDAKGRTLQSIYPRLASGASSLLHLYGTAEQPSPTLVLGRVHRVYPTVSAILTDANGDGAADALVSVLPELGDQPFPKGLPAIPVSVDGFAPGTTYPVPPEVTWNAIFGDTGEIYPTFASEVDDRPYVEGYDFLYRADERAASFYPEQKPFKDFQDTFDLAVDGAPFFRGKAEALAVDDVLEKAAYSVEDASGLEGPFIANRTLSLGAVVEVRQAPNGVLNLSGLTVTRGGILILSGAGDIELSDLKFAPGLDFPLVVVSLQGNVTLSVPDGRRGPLPVSILAPSGQLTLKSSGKEPVGIAGSLVVDTLDLKQWAGGGDLYYETRLDPTDAARDTLYRVLCSDAAVRW